MKTLTLLLLFVGLSNAANISINNGAGLDITGVTEIDCVGIKVNYDGTNQCCIGNSCNIYSEVEFLNSTTKCPDLVLDGYLYQVSSNIKIIHNVKLLSVDAGSMSSCRKPDNSFPTTGGFNQFNLDFNNVFAGIGSMYFDVDLWRINMTSIDGNLLCQGGVNVDLIFTNSFE